MSLRAWRFTMRVICFLAASSLQQQVPRLACMVCIACAVGLFIVMAPGWRDVALHPPWFMDGLPESFPIPPPTSMRNLAADVYVSRTADLDTSLRRWESTPAVRI